MGTGFSNLFHRRIVRSTRYSIQGLIATAKAEEAFRIELFLAAVLVPLALILGDTGVEKGLLAGTVLLVLVVELLNSAIESVVDRFGPEENELSGRAKDQGSAAVLISLLTVVFTWFTVLFF